MQKTSFLDKFTEPKNNTRISAQTISRLNAD